MGRFAPTTQPTSVTTAGVTVTIPIGPARATRALTRLTVGKTSGDATTFTATWSTDSNVTDPTMTIATLTGGTTSVALDIEAPTTRGFSWDEAGHAGNVYVKITPNTGTNNAFKVACFMDA